MKSSKNSSGRRLTPDARRRQLIDATRGLFAERPEEQISTADVAAAAGVTRALVHHYFHGIDELREAVALDLARSFAATLTQRPGTTVADRVRANVNAYLDALEANHHAWLATIGAEAGPAATTLAGRALRQGILERILQNNAEIIQDTPWARLCLTGYIAFTDAVCRQWARGQASRDQVQQAMTDTLLHLLQHTIPNGNPTHQHPNTRKRSASRRP